MRGHVETPSPVVDRMVDQLFDEDSPAEGDRILFPGSGDGPFVTAVQNYCTKRNLPQPEGVAIEDDKELLTAARKRVDNAAVEFVADDFLALDRDEIGTFDYVIGNPPYVPIERLDAAEKRRYRESFRAAEGRFDLYILFFEQALDLLADGGRLVFLSPEKFEYTNTASELRRLLTSHHVERLEHLPEDTFDEHVTYPAVTTVHDRAAADTRVHRRDGTTDVVELPRDGASWAPYLRDGDASDYSYDTSRTLADVTRRISCGVATGRDNIFVRPREDVPDALLEEGWTYPTTSGTQLAANDGPANDDHIICPYDEQGNLPPEDDLDAYLRWAERHRDELEARSCVEGGKDWYAWHETPPLSDIYGTPKLLCKDVCETPTFWADREGDIVPQHSIYYIVPSDGVGLDPLLEYLNSPKARAWLEANAQKAANDYYRLQTRVLNRLPVPESIPQTQAPRADSSQTHSSRFTHSPDSATVASSTRAPTTPAQNRQRSEANFRDPTTGSRMAGADDSGIETRPPETLEPHPLNDEIYGDRSDLDDGFLESVDTHGVIEPVVVDPSPERCDEGQAVIVSGHRRVEAAIEVGLGEVPVIVREIGDELARRELLVIYNEGREKVFSQKMREALTLEAVERERAQRRQGDRTDLVENSPRSTDQTGDVEYGRTRDKVAEAVNLGSGRNFQKAKTVWKEAQDGDEVAQRQVELLDEGEQSIHGAYIAVTEQEDSGDEERSAGATTSTDEGGSTAATDTVSPPGSATTSDSVDEENADTGDDSAAALPEIPPEYGVHRGDARYLRERLADHFTGDELDGLLNVAITSPPYFDRKDYEADPERQVGFGDSYGEYLEDLRSVFRQTYDLTSESGTLWVIVNTVKQDNRVIRLPFDIADICENLPGRESCPECGAALRRERATGHLTCPECGTECDPLGESWRLQDIVVWDKNRARPWSGEGRFRNVSEYILCFSKSPTDFAFDLDAVRIADPDELEWWIKHPERYHPRGKTPSTIWEYTTQAQGSWGGDVDHPAPFPPGLVERIVNLTTEPGDVVFDPFAGTGTVPAVAEALDRKPLGLEVSADYIDGYSKRRKEMHEKLESRSAVEERQANLEAKICKLRQLKYPRELLRRVRKSLDASLVGELKINTALQLSHEIIDREKFDADRLLMEDTLYLVVDDGVPETRRDEIQAAARACAERPPCSKFGIEASISVVSVSEVTEQIDSGAWSWNPPYYLYADDNYHDHTATLDLAEWRSSVENPEEWRRQHASNDYPPILSNLGLSIKTES